MSTHSQTPDIGSEFGFAPDPGLAYKYGEVILNKELCDMTAESGVNTRVTGPISLTDLTFHLIFIATLN